MKKIAAVRLTDTHLKETNIEINKSVYRQTISFCKENGLDTVYHLGDIFNSRKAQSLDVLQAFLEILDMFRKAGIRLVAIPGNHDKTDYTSRLSFLDPFESHPSFHLVTSYEIFELFPGTHITMIPFFADIEYKEWLEFAEKRVSQLDQCRHILFTHIGVHGAIMNNGIAIDGILKDLFEPYEYVDIGHYHDLQIIDKFRYIGSSIQHNYGENSEKGLSILYDDLSFETKVLDYPKYHKIETNVADLTFKDIEEIRKEVESSGDNIRIVLIGDEKEIKSFNKQALLAAGVSVAIKQEEISRNEIDERSEPFTQHTLLDEFEVFCKRENLDLETGKKYLLQALSTTNQDRNA